LNTADKSRIGKSPLSRSPHLPQMHNRPTTDHLRRLQYHGNVCISGLTASGKTTHSHLLAGEFGLTYVSGSQIQLNFLGVSPIQSKDFWITLEAKALWDKSQFRRIDAELLRLEEGAEGYVFDTSTMPWRHQRPALCIWLESSLESRVVKSIVSHRGRGRVALDDYRDRLLEKDAATLNLYKELYDIDIGFDLSRFDLVLDISTLITEPTLEASLHSIAVTHRIIRAAVGAYLTGFEIFEDQLKEAIRDHSDLVVRSRVNSAGDSV